MTAGLSGLSGRLRRQCVRRGDRGDGLPGNGDIALSNALGRYYIAAANDDMEHAPSDRDNRTYDRTVAIMYSIWHADYDNGSTRSTLP